MPVKAAAKEKSLEIQCISQKQEIATTITKTAVD